MEISLRNRYEYYGVVGMKATENECFFLSRETLVSDIGAMDNGFV